MTFPSLLDDCRQATLLAERDADGGLPLPARAQLRAHLRLCPPCRRYAAQSRLIARWAASAAAVSPDVSLAGETRLRLQQVLDSRTSF